MPGITPVGIEYRLNVKTTHKLVIQKKRHMGAKRVAAVTAEVHKLLEVGFIMECRYPK